jgi:hypothetical protein
VYQKQGEAQPKAFLVLPVSGSVPLDLFTLMLRRALELMGCTVKVIGALHIHYSVSLYH